MRDMSFYEFKSRFYDVRINSREINSLKKSLDTIADDILGTVTSGAVDYSKDRIQHQTEPDVAIINAIYRIDEEKRIMLARLSYLKEQNAWAEEMIYSLDGIGREVLRLYYLESLSMEQVSKRLNYSTSHCWRLWRETLYRLYRGRSS
jgi:DNA-directed RNA polymerase specialized sigma24 family protein